MRLRKVLITSIATATVALVSPAVTPLVDLPSIAQADTKVSVSFNTFYEDLAPHGSWVNYQDSYVFVPAGISADWRPYTVGHWVKTERYGWLWVSDEPFGWATYHYGRWGHAEDIGWYWVPGKRWAPAWVAWRRSGDHVVWAPLPPDGDDVTIEVRIEEIPDIYWVAVPSRSFLDVDLSVVIIDDDSERLRIVEAAEPVGSVTIENNIVVNNVIDIDYVEKATDKKVETVEVKETQDPKQAGKGAEGQVSVFTGEVKEEGDAKPAEVKDVEEVKKEKAEATGQPPEGGEQTGKKKKTTGEPAQDGQPAQAETEQQKKKATGEAEQAEEAQPEQGQDQPVKKKKASEQTEEPDATQAEQGQDQPVKKKKSKASEQTEEPDATQAEQGQDQPVKKKKKSQASEESAQPEQGQGQPPKRKQKGAPEEPAQQPEACDPATGQNC
jgi:hypothetical protein